MCIIIYIGNRTSKHILRREFMSNTKKVLIAILAATIGVCLVGFFANKEEKEGTIVTPTEN